MFYLLSRLFHADRISKAKFGRALGLNVNEGINLHSKEPFTLEGEEVRTLYVLYTYSIRALYVL